MLTPVSSAAILSFEPAASPKRFEVWREDWVRTVFADDNLWGSDKNVASFLALHLNRTTRAAFPSYGTIGKGLDMDRANVRRSIRRLIARGYLVREPRGRGQTNLYLPAGGVVTVTTGVVTVTPAVLSQLPPRTSEVEPLKEPLREGVVTVTTGKEERGGLPRGPSAPSKEEKQAKPSEVQSCPSPNNEGVPRAAPNGGGDSVWVKYDTPQWDLIERYGHRATGKVFFRFGRLDGDWFLKADLKAIEVLAEANGGSQ